MRSADLLAMIAPLDKGSKLEAVVTKIRTRKGLKVRRFSGYLVID